ncbi:universal stress protein [Haloferax namakaokahaiae]|uniref:Universal stress protein n=1 Tax=Haloferax namakaokahaiae TaxID=1748331 RepID=A0ABD5ZB55_9EURY
MTLVVPFDGSELAEAALVRGAEFGTVFDEGVVAVTVIPERNTNYARERGWIGQEESFDIDAIVSTLRDRVAERCPDAEFEHVVVDRHAPSGTIARAIRSLARNRDASMVFVGSDNAGHFVSSVSTVGGNVASDDAYDVVIVRTPISAKRTE